MSSAVAPLAPIRLLVVADHPDVGALARRLAEAGANAVVAGLSAAEATPAGIADDDYDAVVLTGPHTTALAALARLRDGGVPAPVLAVVDDDADGAALVAAGAVDYVVGAEPAGLAARATLLGRLGRAERAHAATLAVSHDLRGPLNAISVALDALRDDAVAGADRARYAAVVARSIDRADRLLTDLVTAAQLAVGSLRLEPTAVSTRSLLEEVRRERAASARAGAPIELGAIDDMVVRADRERLAQALRGLIDSAARETGCGGAIELGARAAASTVTLVVRHRGAAIPPSDARARSGLAIARGIARAHGGNAVAGPAPGGGTELAILLPIPIR